MELREQVEAEDRQEQLVQLHTANKQRQAEVIAALSRAFHSHEYEEARHLVAQLSYWVRLDEAIQNKL
jgi:DnaJ-domain-containing protein 1